MDMKLPISRYIDLRGLLAVVSERTGDFPFLIEPFIYRENKFPDAFPSVPFPGRCLRSLAGGEREGGRMLVAAVHATLLFIAPPFHRPLDTKFTAAQLHKQVDTYVPQSRRLFLLSCMHYSLLKHVSLARG